MSRPVLGAFLCLIVSLFCWGWWGSGFRVLAAPAHNIVVAGLLADTYARGQTESRLHSHGHISLAFAGQRLGLPVARLAGPTAHFPGDRLAAGLAWLGALFAAAAFLKVRADTAIEDRRFRLQLDGILSEWEVRTPCRPNRSTQPIGRLPNAQSWSTFGRSKF